MSETSKDMLRQRAEALLDTCRQRGLKIATAESCTGGLIAAMLTEIPGSSDVVERGFVTYSNEAKHDMLGVPDAMLKEHGAVSEPVANAMADGALARSNADLSVAVTGIAGPGGGSDQKPVGLVFAAGARMGFGTQVHEFRFGALSRRAIREATVHAAFDILESLAEKA